MVSGIVFIAMAAPAADARDIFQIEFRDCVVAARRLPGFSIWRGRHYVVRQNSHLVGPRAGSWPQGGKQLPLPQSSAAQPALADQQGRGDVQRDLHRASASRAVSATRPTDVDRSGHVRGVDGTGDERARRQIGSATRSRPRPRPRVGVSSNGRPLAFTGNGNCRHDGRPARAGLRRRAARARPPRTALAPQAARARAAAVAARSGPVGPRPPWRRRWAGRRGRRPRTSFRRGCTPACRRRADAGGYVSRVPLAVRARLHRVELGVEAGARHQLVVAPGLDQTWRRRARGSGRPSARSRSGATRAA